MRMFVAGVLTTLALSLLASALVFWLAEREARREAIRRGRERAAAGVRATEEATSRVLASIAVQHKTGRAVYVMRPDAFIPMNWMHPQ